MFALRLAVHANRWRTAVRFLVGGRVESPPGSLKTDNDRWVFGDGANDRPGLEQQGGVKACGSSSARPPIAGLGKPLVRIDQTH
jgi:hypothetical protein